MNSFSLAKIAKKQGSGFLHGVQAAGDPETFPASLPPENGGLEADPFLLGRLGLFSGAFAVSFREGIYTCVF